MMRNVRLLFLFGVLCLRAAETVPGGETRTYTVQAGSGAALRIRYIPIQGVPGILTVLDAAGQELLYADLGRRTPAAREVIIPLPAPGAYQVRLAPPNHAALSRQFDLAISTVADTGFAGDVERLLGDGERLHRLKDRPSVAQAEDFYRGALAAWKKSANPLRVADTLCHLAAVQYDRSNLQDALASYEEALRLFASARNDAGMAAAQYGISLTTHDMNQAKRSAEALRECLLLRDRLIDQRGQAEALLIEGSLHMQAARNDAARAAFTRTVELARQAGDRAREADGNNFLGVLAFQLSNWEEAEARYQEAVRIQRDEQDFARLAQSLSNLGALSIARGDLGKALAFLEEALPLRQKYGSPTQAANTIYNIGVVQAELRQSERALASYEAALAEFHQAKIPRAEGFVLQAMAEVYGRLGQQDRMDAVLQQALAVWRGMSDRRGEALTLVRLGASYATQGKQAQAKETLERARIVAREAGARREEAQALVQLAKASSLHSDFKQARAESTQCRTAATLLSDRLTEAHCLVELGKALNGDSKFEAAATTLTAALRILREFEDEEGKALALLHLARAQMRSNHLADASDSIAQAIAIGEELRARLHVPRYQMGLMAPQRESYDLAIEIQMRRHAANPRAGLDREAFRISEQARARVLLDTLAEARQNIRADVDAGTIAQAREIGNLLGAKASRLTTLLAGPHEDAREKVLRRELAELLDRYHRLQGQIRVRSPRYAALMHPQTADVASVQTNILSGGDALVEFWLGRERSFAWVITRSGFESFELPAAPVLEKLAERTQAAIMDPKRTGNVPLDLSARILGPIARQPGIGRLLIAADGALQNIPFGALTAPGGSLPLISRQAVITIPSATVAGLLLASRPKPARSVAIFADPVFSSGDERVPHRPQVTSAAPSLPLQRLRFSEEEAAGIATLAGRGALRVSGIAANHEAVQSPGLADFRMIHFATHAIWDNLQPDLSGLALSMVDALGQPRQGMLRLHEIYNLQLNSDLVVLSACQTAAGKAVPGEGLIGLARGFLSAGSLQVLATLWDVRDRSTAHFMHWFYEGLLTRKLGAAGALRYAQLEMRKDKRWSHPYYWAGFTLIGFAPDHRD